MLGQAGMRRCRRDGHGARPGRGGARPGHRWSAHRPRRADAASCRSRRSTSPSTARRGSSPCATRRAASARPRRRSTWVRRWPSYGRRVLLVDFDPQGALSVGLGVNPHELDRTVYNLLMERDVTADDVLLKTNVPGMDLLPSNIDLSAAEVQLVGEVAREQTLARVLGPVLPRLRLHPHRLPALARPADRQRADRRARRDHPAGVRVLRPPRRRAADPDHREGAGAA